MLSSASFAQQYEYKLSEMNSKYTPEYYKYMYDEDNGNSTATFTTPATSMSTTSRATRCSRRANRSSAATASTHTPHR